MWPNIATVIRTMLLALAFAATAAVAQPAAKGVPFVSVLARRGEHAEAERLAREAVSLSEGTDALDVQGEAYADLAEVLAAGGRPERAAEALEQALARYERKENVVMAERVRARLVELRSETAAQRA